MSKSDKNNVYDLLVGNQIKSVGKYVKQLIVK